MNVREMVAAVKKDGKVQINGWTVKVDGGIYYALNAKNRIGCFGNEAKVHNFVRHNSAS